MDRGGYITRMICPLSRPKCIWKHNIKMDIKEIKHGDMAKYKNHTNQPPGSTRGGKFFHQISDYQLLK
jgi:hypothetical protein